MKELNLNKVGIHVYCTRCNRMKKPIGRSAPMQMAVCDNDCPGYFLDPQVGDLWPGETEAEFGFPAQNAGTRQ